MDLSISCSLVHGTALQSPPRALALLKQMHRDERGAVSLETVLIVGAIALPILIFVLKVDSLAFGKRSPPRGILEGATASEVSFEAPEFIWTEWGIQLQGKANLPVAGTLAFVQLVKFNREEKTSGGLVKRAASLIPQVDPPSFEWQLDRAGTPTMPFFSEHVVTATTGDARVIIVDSPGRDGVYTGFVTESFISDRFKSYFMYKPDGLGAIWVPLKGISWGWQAYWNNTTPDTQIDSPMPFDPNALVTWERQADPSTYTTLQGVQQVPRVVP